jgi:uncharacterized repeat protein (TIGR03803 family)
MSRDNQSRYESQPRGNSGRLPRLVCRVAWVSRIRWQAALALLASGILLLSSVMASRPAQEPEAAPIYKVLHSFAGGLKDGSSPFGGVILGVAGNLYGTTEHGGTSGKCGFAGCGTIFKLTSSGSLKVLHSFAGPPGDGAIPLGGLIRDGAGNLYGTTNTGGTSSVCGSAGCGTIFELTAGGTEKVLHNFAGFPTDGATPEAGLVRDAAGNLYGTTRFGGDTHTCGTFGCGTIFKLTPSGTESVLYSFPGPPDGKEPLGGLIQDAAGNFYGTTGFGGAFQNGDVYELTSDGIESVLHSFAGHPTDGTIPRGDLIRDSAGNLYGTTGGGGASNNCGADGCGAIFQLTPGGTETILHSFAGPPADGLAPYAGLIPDSAGNLNGTTAGGASSNCGSVGCGTIYKLVAGGTETVLHSFKGSPKDGSFPTSNLVRDAAGNLYGTTKNGGASNLGVVFKLTPK